MRQALRGEPRPRRSPGAPDELDLMRERASDLTRRLTPRCGRSRPAPVPPERRRHPRSRCGAPTGARAQAAGARAGQDHDGNPDRGGRGEAGSRARPLSERTASTSCSTPLCLIASAPSTSSKVRSPLSGSTPPRPPSWPLGCRCGRRDRRCTARAGQRQRLGHHRHQRAFHHREDLAAITDEALQLANTTDQLATIDTGSRETARLASLAATVAEREQTVAARQQGLSDSRTSCAD